MLNGYEVNEIGKRVKEPELEKLFAENKNVYSFSKLNTIDNCLYEAYLAYIKHKKGIPNVYGCMGTEIHDTLEMIVHGECDENALVPAMNKELSDMEMLGIEFPKDRNGGDSIKNSWVSNMNHFCRNFVKPKGKFITEKFLLLKIDDDHYLQGYCDLIKIVDEKNKIVSVYDWKTSSQFSNSDLIHHGRQLVIYQMALEQLGYQVKECAWIMLKYCTVKYKGKKTVRSKEESLIEKVCERRKIVETLQTDIESKLSKLGYDELDIEVMLHNAKETNSFEAFPEVIQTQYKVLPYVRKYEVNEDTKKECLDYIKNTYQKWESIEGDEKKYPPRSFTRITKTGKESDDIFFCTNLCGYKDCPHLKKYLDTKENGSEEDNLF